MSIGERRLDRRTLLRWGGGIALASPFASALAACGGRDEATLTAGFQDWIVRLHPAIEDSLDESTSVGQSVAIERAGTSRLALEGEGDKSGMDVYVGITPFDEMVSLAKSGAIEPWDELVPDAIVDDLPPVVRAEGTLDGKVYAWPFLLDLTVQGWNIELVERADLDPSRPPATWDEYIANARRIQEVGAAPYGCTFDARGWRSLVPITYTFSTDVYTDDGLFDYTNEAVAHALEVMRRMAEVANPDVLDPYMTAGAGFTTDEGAFASQLVGYYLKYTNAHIRAANTWPDPSSLALASSPTPAGGPGATVFWTTSIALPRYGRHRPSAAAFAEALTYDEPVWRESMGNGRQSSGQLAPFLSLWKKWRGEQPGWVPEWASHTFGQLRTAKPIKPHRLGARQFTLAHPYLERYLRGETSARLALRAAMDAVRQAAA